MFMASINKVKHLYSARGYSISVILGDGQFEAARTVLLNANIQPNIAAPNEHVPEVERFIQTVKERARSTYHSLPFKRLPNTMLIRMITNCVFWLNILPTGRGLTKTMSPRTLITGFMMDCNKHCKLAFGDYVQVHEEADNTMASRTNGAIAMGPTGNAQGGYFFFNLNTGRTITRYTWTSLPMPKEVIDRVHYFANRDKAQNNLFFTRSDNTDFDGGLAGVDEDDNDSDYDPNDDANNEDEDDDNINDDGSDTDSDAHNNINDDGSDTGSDDHDANNHQPFDANNNNIDNNNATEHHFDNSINDSQMNDNEDVNATANDHVIDDDEPAAQTQIARLQDSDASSTTSNDNGLDKMAGVNLPAPVPEDIIETKPESLITTRSGRQVKRPDRLIEADVLTMHGQVMTISQNDTEVLCKPPYQGSQNILQAVALTQYHVKKGLKVFGKKGADAVLSELQQVHDLEVLDPVSNLTEDEKAAALEYLMFLSEKRDGRIKARGCADGRKQRAYIAKEDASSPTVSLEALLLTTVIDAKENRYVATVDVPGAFTQTDMDELVYVRLVGPMAEALIKISPSMYRKHILLENGQKVLYAKLRKALYGTLRAALLFWRDMSSTLQNFGFIINPYDACVANMTIDGYQCTVVWHVDDLKISHVSKEIVESLIKALNNRYGKLKPITVQVGKVHPYLGMTIDYSVQGKVMINMIDYIKKILDETDEIFPGTSSTPAANHLFSVNRNATKLSTKDADFFHYLTAKLLFLCKRARPDIQTAVAFLSTRVQQPDVDDQKKLGRAINYLRGSLDMILTLEADSPLILKWYIDGSYAVHEDMKSHTGGMLTLGNGSVYAPSTKQKINSKSSTEAELIAVNDVLGQALWTKYFLESQGLVVSRNTVLQDNKSAMLLEANGRLSSSKKTRRINIRYFFVQDRIQAGNLNIEHFPTKEMTADFFTKPLQGAAFYKFRDLILNYKASRSQECVGKYVVESQSIGRLATNLSPNNKIHDIANSIRTMQTSKKS
jgi:hypothetical protein